MNKTAMQQMYDEIESLRKITWSISIDDLQRMIANLYINIEKEQIIESHAVGRIKEVSGDLTDGLRYYEQTFNNN